MNSREQKLNAFTLIELLVVIAIIGILATVSVVALNNARAKSRDAKRLADIKNIQTALAMYYNDKKEYPMTLISGQALYATSLDGAGNVATTTYIANIPTPPTPADGANCTTASNALAYSTSSDLQSYILSTCISSPPQTQASSSGAAIYISDPIQSQPCGQYIIDYAGQKYQTIQIGTQCWMKENLNVGTTVAISTGQTNNSIIEKYCANDLNSNCLLYGGLYKWDEMMNWSVVEGAQGICPPGWHIPTLAEQNILLAYTTTPGQTCDPARYDAWGCSGAGTVLQRPSGFYMTMGGNCTAAGVCASQGSYGYWWSSYIGGNSGYLQVFWTGSASVMQLHQDRSLGVSARCLKN